MVLSFGFFLTGLRVVHGAFHYTLGLPRLTTDCVMLMSSIADARLHACRPLEPFTAPSALPGGRRSGSHGGAQVGPWRGSARATLSDQPASRRTNSSRESTSDGWIVAELAANVVAITVASRNGVCRSSGY